jgi:hypothetical protein
MQKRNTCVNRQQRIPFHCLRRLLFVQIRAQKCALIPTNGVGIDVHFSQTPHHFKLIINAGFFNVVVVAKHKNVDDEDFFERAPWCVVFFSLLFGSKNIEVSLLLFDYLIVC